MAHNSLIFHRLSVWATENAQIIISSDPSFFWHKFDTDRLATVLKSLLIEERQFSIAILYSVSERYSPFMLKYTLHFFYSN